MSWKKDLMRFTSLDKFQLFWKSVKEQGGILGAMGQLYRTDELKTGDLIGTDNYGNQYFENRRYMIGKSRWVDYTKAVFLDYDASAVPPEWHRWLHYMTDSPPSTHPPEKRKWFLEHQQNESIFIDKRYNPYSTTRPKIEAWEPESVTSSAGSTKRIE